MTKLQWKWTGVGLVIALALYLLYPSIDWYTKDAGERESLEARKLRPKHMLNLGLDLKGGSHLLWELAVDKLPPSANIRDALDQAQQIIRNRIDEYGVAEPYIARQGERWIVVQLPGIKDPQQAKALVGQTALLEFHMVDESDAAQKARQDIYEKVGYPFVELPGQKVAVSSAAAALLPPGTILTRSRDKGDNQLYILRSSVAITGELLDSAAPDTDSGKVVVNFRWKPEGGAIFWNLTSANVGKKMAIVLDGVVQSAPVIQSPIRDSGIITGNFDMQEARQLAIVLRSGALPAPLTIIEERTIGASLGEDSIRQGIGAALTGAAFVLGFMLLYYKLAGFFADVAMVLNLLFVLAMMAYYDATLTMPGIAGIALTIGMAIDANVLIFERIREELKEGKPTRIAVDAGYDKALSAIVDSNLTTLIAALFLFQFGTGPIKGFAVTLTLGILCSMFTAIVTTKMMFETYLGGGPVEGLSI